MITVVLFSVFCSLIVTINADIHPGDDIVLKSKTLFDNHWLSCSPRFNNAIRCGLGTCPNTVMQDEDWTTCPNVVLTISSLVKGPHEPLLWNDQVILVDKRWSTDWLSCPRDGGACLMKPCMNLAGGCDDEVFRIYAPGRQGSCHVNTWEQHGCSGEPILSGDIVFLLADRQIGVQNLWLSANHVAITTSTAPGQIIDNTDATKTPSEAWQIFKR